MFHSEPKRAPHLKDLNTWLSQAVLPFLKEFASAFQRVTDVFEEIVESPFEAIACNMIQENFSSEADRFHKFGENSIRIAYISLENDERRKAQVAVNLAGTFFEISNLLTKISSDALEQLPPPVLLGLVANVQDELNDCMQKLSGELS